MRVFQAHPEIGAVSGGASILQESLPGEWTILFQFPCVPPGQLLIRATLGAPIFNAWFFRKSLVDELDGLDLRFLYVSDRDFLIRMAFQPEQRAGLEKLVFHYRMHPGSYTLSGRDSGEDRYVFQSRELAERYLGETSLGTEERSIFRAWHSQITTEQILTARRAGAYARVLGYALYGMKFNPIGWPVVCFQKIYATS
jgi:hypothetical protein